MATVFATRRILFRSAMMLGVGAASTHKARNIFRMDSLATGEVGISLSSRAERTSRRYRDSEAEMMGQISSGCVTGLLAGIAVSMMSKVIIFVAGAIASTLVLAYRLGLNPASLVKMPERYKPKNVIPRISQKLPFKAAFSISLLIAAFGHI